MSEYNREEMYKLWSDVVEHKGNAEEKALEYLNKVEQASVEELKKAYPMQLRENRIERDLLDIADALPESRKVALKMTEFVDKHFEELYGNWCINSYHKLGKKLLSQHPDDENLADNWLNIAQKGINFVREKYNSDWGTFQFLNILDTIKDTTPNSVKYDSLIVDILNKRIDTRDMFVCELDRKIIRDNPNNPKILDKAFQSLSKELSGVAHYNANEMKQDFLSKEDKYKIYLTIVSENINSPEVVERCLAAGAELEEVWNSLISNKAYEKGYRENNFEDRFVEKLNKGEIVFENCNAEQISKVADKLNTNTLKELTTIANDAINSKKSFAKKWHRKPDISAEDYENRENLIHLCNQRLKQEALKKAGTENNPPAIFVEVFVGETYGDVAEQVYIKDEKGEYQATEIMDDLETSDNEISAREMLEEVMKNRGIVATENGVYTASADGDFRQIESRPGYSYRSLGNNAYWRDVEGVGIRYTREAYNGSTLVSKNPVTGKFEDVPFNINYCNGDHLQGYKKDKDGNSKTVIYKRDKKNGKFYPDAEFPAGEYMGGGYGEDGTYSISFYSNDGKQYRYVSNESGSALGVRDGMSGKYRQIDRFHAVYENKPHVQRPMENLKEVLANSKTRMKNKFSHPEQNKVSETVFDTLSRDEGGR